MWSFCAEFSLKSEVDESFEIHVLMNFLRVTWLTIKDSLQSKVFLGIFKYIALKTSALHTKRWSMQRTKFFILFCSSIQEKWHPSLVLLLRTRWKLLQFRNETTFLLLLQCKYGKVSFSLGFFAIITWGTAQDWRSFCLNYFAAVAENAFPHWKKNWRRDLLITQSNFKRVPLGLKRRSLCPKRKQFVIKRKSRVLLSISWKVLSSIPTLKKELSYSVD